MVNDMGYFKEKIIWPIRYKRAVKRADKRAHYANCNQYVIAYGGSLLVMSKRDIDTAIAQRIFRKGVTPGMIRKKAIYVASKFK